MERLVATVIILGVIVGGGVTALLFSMNDLSFPQFGTHNVVFVRDFNDSRIVLVYEDGKLIKAKLANNSIITYYPKYGGVLHVNMTGRSFYGITSPTPASVVLAVFGLNAGIGLATICFSYQIFYRQFKIGKMALLGVLFGSFIIGFSLVSPFFVLFQQ